MRKLITKPSFRREENKFVVEGVCLFEELLKCPKKIKSVFYSFKLSKNKKAVELLNKAKTKKIQCWLISDDLMDDLSDTCTPQGVIAIADMFEYKIDDLLCIDKCILLLVDRIQDPGNLGTIIRAADAFKSTGIILSKGTVDLYNPKTIRASMGSIFHIPIITSANIISVINTIKKYNITILASSPKSDLAIDKVSLTSSIGLIIGNEAEGISKEVVILSDKKIKIPIPGSAESLNAAASSAIMLYEVSRQRGFRS